MRAALRSVFAKVREKDLLAYVLQTARLHRWRCYHTWNSAHSEAGFPDVVCVRPPRILVAELKREGCSPTPSQRAWLEAFRGVPGVDVMVWKPSDRDEIARFLADPGGRTAALSAGRITR